MLGFRFLIVLLWLASTCAVATAAEWQSKVSPSLQAAAKSADSLEVLIRMDGDAGLGKSSPQGDARQKATAAYERLREAAGNSQSELLAVLAADNIEYRAFWIVNVIWARLPVSRLADIAQRSDVVALDANPVLRMQGPVETFSSTAQPKAIEWGVTRVRAPEVWAMGYSGQGVVVAGQDTGYQWDHNALRDKYRGSSGANVVHAYNWHDSIHAIIGSGSNSCGLNSTVPCDDDRHGTHTMGTIVGDDGANNQVGVAPGAKWIGCRNMERGNGTPATYLECFQFFLAPTDAAGLNPDPSKAPHVINNSWGCPPSEGCAIATLEQAVDNLRAAGVMVVVSAGNSGSGCNTVVDPPAIYAGSFSVGSTTSSNAISGFSSRGPVTIDGSNRLKPDIAAPGSSIRSSIPGNNTYSSFSGTSMAGPHVVGVVALLMSADPTLRGNPAAVERILRESAVATTSTQNCGTFAGSVIPNAVFGYGRIDALAAVQRALAEAGQFTDGFEP